MTTKTREARIDLEGVRLSEGQSMAVRVAIEMYIFDLERELAKDLGQIGQNYLARLREVRRLIAKGTHRKVGTWEDEDG